MEIIKRGRIPGEDPSEWECRNCHSVIASRKEEGKFVRGNSDDGDCILFKCPVCGKENWIAASRFN